MTILRSLAVATGGALALAAPAAAHVTLDPEEASADSFARFDFRVPNELPDKATIKFRVRFPAGLTSVSFLPKPGWKRTVVTAKLAKPVTTEGERVTERVAQVTWSGGSIEPGEFEEFAFSAHVPNTPGKRLVFPSLQVFQGGEITRWIGAPDADEPAPRVILTSDGTATPAAVTTAAAANDDGEGRATIALVLAIAGLAAGLIALGVAAGRRTR